MFESDCVFVCTVASKSKKLKRITCYEATIMSWCRNILVVTLIESFLEALADASLHPKSGSK